MADNFLEEINRKPEIIQNYDLLEKIGLWDLIKNFQNEINILEELLEEAVRLFNIQSVPSLIDYVAKKTLNKFIPTYLTFIIEDEVHLDKPNIACYNNLEKVDMNLQIPTLMPYKKIFSLSPTSITFEAFVHMVDDQQLTDVFQPILPEILVPMMGIHGVYGIIVIGKRVLEKKYTETEIKYIDIFMKFTSVSLQNIIHYRRAILDIKTGLYKHSYFMNRLNEELSRIKRYSLDLSILMLDIDHFKKVNDTYGHLAGDFVLLEISKIVKQVIRTEDVAARFGGEELIVLLVCCEVKAAYQVSERIREKIEQYVFEFEDQKIKITVSLGICHADKLAYFSNTSIIANADLALYYSKKNGRNQSTLYRQELKQL